MPVSSSTEHWIKPDALTINLNHFGDPDYLQVSVLAGAVVMAFKQDVIGYNAAHNYRTWPLDAANTYLETTSAYNVYARLTRNEVNARALVVYDSVLRDIEGREITYSEDGNEVLGEANPDYFFVFLGQISASVNSGGGSVQREWTKAFTTGTLYTNQQQNNTTGLLDLMFRPHYDNPLDPNEITWIEALTHLGVSGGITMYVDGGKLNIPSIYAGLPIDNITLKWIETTNSDGTVTRILGVNPDIELGGGLDTEELEEFLRTKNYATESWVTGKNYVNTTTLANELKKYVTLNDDETINGLKNFTKGLKINGLGITNSQDDVIYIDANLVVRGGITMYATDTVDIPSILDSIPTASNTAKGLASFDSTYFSVDDKGYVTLLPDNVGLNEEELAAYLDDKKYATQSWVKSLKYATSTELDLLEDKVNDFLTGSDTDNIINKWRELEVFLSGLSESDNLATILGTKANKATTIAGYGITDAYTKNDVNTLLGNYVTIAGTQTITGEKNFTGGLKVNGSPIVYDATNKYWKLEGDLLVTGGVTMYGDDSAFTPSTIMDALVLDDATLGINDEGQLYVKGGTGGGLTEVHWDDVKGRPTLLSSFTNDVNFLSLDNATQNITQKGVVISTMEVVGAYFKAIGNNQSCIVCDYEENGISENKSQFGWSKNNGTWIYDYDSSSYIRVKDSTPYFNNFTILHSGNWSQYISSTGGGNYLPLSGGTLTGRYDILYLNSSTTGAIIVFNMNGVNKGQVGYYEQKSGVGLYNYATNSGIYVKDARISGMVEISYPECQITVESNRLISLGKTHSIFGYDNAVNGIPTYIDGGDVYIRHGTNHSNISHFTNAGNVHVPQVIYFGRYGQHTNLTDYAGYIGRGSSDQKIIMLSNEDLYFYSRGSHAMTVSYTNLTVMGGITMYSDIRKKTKLQDVELSLSQIANAPLIEHYYNSDDKRTTHVGSIAQYWAGLNDWFCKLDNDGYYTMEIQNAALASAISVARHLQKYETKTDRKIRMMKKRIAQLEDKIEKLKAA